ncbi:113_t:CDS:1, partial [Racocetra fulgida]
MIENNQDIQLGQIIVMDPLVTKYRGRPPTKRLKSLSKSQGYKESAHAHHLMNLQGHNLPIALSAVDLNNNYTIDSNSNALYNE